jgi:diguanylate cyclase (GGDEF)-like protein/PAS domain S-box-containing protein
MRRHSRNSLRGEILSISHNKELGAWLRKEANRAVERVAMQVEVVPNETKQFPSIPAASSSLETGVVPTEIIQEAPSLFVEAAESIGSPLQQEAQRFDALASGQVLPLDQQILLIEEVHRYGRIFDSICNGIAIGDATKPGIPLVYINPAFERITGYCAHEVIGRNCNFLQGRDTHQPGVVRIREAIRGVHDERVLLRNYRKDGMPFWNELYLSPIFDLGGTLTHFVGIQNDVTARVEAELKLSDERDRLHAAAECSMDCIYICEAVRDHANEIVDFTFTYLNSNVAKMVSIPMERLLGGRMCELLPVNRTLGLFDLYKHVALTGEPLVHEFPVQDKDVRSNWIRIQAVKLKDGVVITASDITLRKRIEEQTVLEGQHDSLTALPNRRVLKDRIEQAMLRTNRQKQLMSVFVIDLDGFKMINDTLGHAAGDEALVIIAGRLRRCMRAADSVIRMGGDEFIVVMPELRHQADSEMRATLILDELSLPMTVADRSASVTCSIGIALYSGSALTAEELIHQADVAMYSAKRKGKNQFEVYVAEG